jgi:hypothetical protein
MSRHCLSGTYEISGRLIFVEQSVQQVLLYALPLACPTIKNIIAWVQLLQMWKLQSQCYKHTLNSTYNSWLCACWCSALKKKLHRFTCSQTGDKTWFWDLCNMSVWICVLVRNFLVWIWVHVRNTDLIILVTHWTSNTYCHLIALHGLMWDFLQTSTCYCGSWHFCWDETSCIDKQKKRASVAHIPMCCASQTNNFLGHVSSPAPLSSSSSSSCVFCLFSCWLEFHLLLLTFSHIWKLLRCL